MTKERDALKLALEALNLARAAHGQMLLSDPPQEAWKAWGVSAALTKAMTAASEALAEQPAQTPVAVYRAGLEGEPYHVQFLAHMEGDEVFLYTSPQPAPPPECKTDAEKTAFAFGWWKALEENRKQPAPQEPVAWYDAEKDCAYTLADCEGRAQDDLEPLYLAPASKPWVGLTDEQIKQLAVDVYSPYKEPLIVFARAIEAKLREKNK